MAANMMSHHSGLSLSGSSGIADKAAAVDQLQEEFDSLLSRMKPFVFQLPEKSERARCALWIKKLCEPIVGENVEKLANRNLYARVMLAMVRARLLEAPFHKKPDSLPLAPLPSYAAPYLASPTQRKAAPEWLDDISTADDTLATSDLSRCHDDRKHGGASSSKNGLRQRGGDTSDDGDDEILQKNSDYGVKPATSDRLKSAQQKFAEIVSSPIKQRPSPANSLFSSSTHSHLDNNEKNSDIDDRSSRSKERHSTSATSMTNGNTHKVLPEPPGRPTSSSGRYQGNKAPLKSSLSPSHSVATGQHEWSRLLRKDDMRTGSNSPSRPALPRACDSAAVVSRRSQSAQRNRTGQRAGSRSPPRARAENDDRGAGRRPRGISSDRRSNGLISRGDIKRETRFENGAARGKLYGDRARVRENLDCSTDDDSIADILGDSAHPWNGGEDSGRYLSASGSVGRRSPGGGAERLRASGDGLQAQIQIDKEVEIKAQMGQARLHEERLKLQQKHDEEVKKILARKNAELDELRDHYRRKLREEEEAAAALERRLQGVVRDAAAVRDTKDRQITELARAADETTATRRNVEVTRINELITEHEQEKLEMQKAHTASVHELMEETHSRLRKMETDYSHQTIATADMTKELETRIHHLTTDAETMKSAKEKLEEQRTDSLIQIQAFTSELKCLKESNEDLERDLKKQSDEHEHALRLAADKHRSALTFAQKEQRLTESRHEDALAEMVQTVGLLKERLAENEAARTKKIREMEEERERERECETHVYDKKIQRAQTELEQVEQESKKRIGALEQALGSKERALEETESRLRRQAQESDTALSELRRQVEVSSNEMFAEMKAQMDQVEKDLSKSKQLRERQSREHEKQIQELKGAHEKQAKVAQKVAEREREQVADAAARERQMLLEAHKQELDHVRMSGKEEQHRLELLLRQRREEHDKTTANLSEKLRDAQDETSRTEQVRAQQVSELGLAREEERRGRELSHQRALEQLKAEGEKARHILQKAHTAEIDEMLEKTNEKLEAIENEYGERLRQATEAAAEAESAAEAAREEHEREMENTRSEARRAEGRHDEAMRARRRERAEMAASLGRELEEARSRARRLEGELEACEAESEEAVLEVRLEMEAKARGMLPASARAQLEHTIASLRKQVETLKERIRVLQDS